MKNKGININMTWKMFLKRFIFLILPLCIIAFIGTNYYLDAENLYYQKYEKVMARNVLEGNYITNIGKYNDRLFQKYIIENSNECPEIIVIGSSRTMLINKYQFGNYSFFNNSINGATIEDIVTLMMLYDKKALAPKYLIIGIDPWILNEKNGQYRWKTIQKDYNDALNKLKLETINIDTSFTEKKENKLFSISYFFASLNKEIKQKRKVFITKKKYNEKTTKIKDGSLIYGKSTRNRSQEAIDKIVNEYISRKFFGFEGNGNFYEKNKKIFEVFIDYILKKNVKITFYFSPYHPKVFNFFSKNEKYKNFIETEKYYKAFAEKKNIQCISSFNPNEFGLDSTYFYDAQNSNENCVSKLINKFKF